jgi:uncharacterized protein YbjQ (UPF0145 family)
MTNQSLLDMEAARRQAQWDEALRRDALPDYIAQRLNAAAAGRTPWLSTMTPAELLLARSHGVRPIATVSGTCWYQYGYSWTEGHATGWASALDRIRREALACGANAVVDVKMRTTNSDTGSSMDFTLLGTAVRIDGLSPSTEPVIATVPALEFVRLLEMGIVPVGIAVGARYEWITDYNNVFSGNWSFNNQPLGTLSAFWESIRRDAHAFLREDVKSQRGDGVLAHVQFGQLIKREGEANSQNPPMYLGRHIVIGTVVHTRRGDGVPHHIRTVVDMRDDLSPLLDPVEHANNVYQDNESDEAI